MNADRRTSSNGSGVEDQRTTYIAFVLMVLFAGANPVAIRLGGAELPPFWSATLRSGGAAVIFWLLVALRRAKLPRGRALLGAVVYGLVSVGIAYTFLYYGLVRAPAGMAGAFLGLAPLATLFLARLHGLETLRWQAIAGAVVSLAGVVIGVVGGLSGQVHVGSLLALLVAVSCFAEGGIVLKVFPRSDPLVTNVVAFTVGAPILAVVSRLSGEAWIWPSRGAVWAAVGYQIVLGSVVVFYLYAYILSRWSASQTAYSFLLMPVGTVVVASWVLGETITASFLLGAVLVLAGVWMGAIHRAPEAAELVCTPVPNKVIC